MTCTACDLCKSRTQIVRPTACVSGGLIAIGEAPGADEDAAGQGFVGQAGKVLDRLLVAQGLTRRQGYGVANIVRCRPPENRKPSRAEVNTCLPRLADFLLHTRPRVILCVGGTATSAFLGAGALSARIELNSADDGWGSPSLAHPVLRPVLEQLAARVIPMPHTSGLAFNRNAPDGRRWSEIGAAQVAWAASFVR